MNEFLLNFSNKEIALFIWVAIMLFIMMISKSFRNLIKVIFETILSSHFLILLGSFFIYIFAIIFVLYQLDFWKFTLLKDTLFWTFGFALILVFKVPKLKSFIAFKAIIKDSIKWAIFIEFLIAYFTFSLKVELILLPIIVFIVLLQVVSDNNKEYVLVSSFLKNVSLLIGVIILAYVSYKTVTQWSNLAKIDNLKAFILPIILTVLYIPFIYGLKILMLYGDIFRKLKFYFKDDSIKKKIKIEILKIGHVNLEKLIRINKDFVKHRPYKTNNIRAKIISTLYTEDL